MSPSMFGLFTAGLAALAPLVSAYTTPTGTEPKGNPISQPGLNTIVPVGESFTITWEPTTEGTVSLVLLKGPAENLIPVYAIAEKIENSGTYTWDPKTTLEASEGAKGYGIQLIDDKTGQYQYTTQFGISKGPECNGVAPSSAVSTPYGGGYPVSTPAASSKVASSSAAGYPVSSPVVSSSANATTIVTKTSSMVLSTGAPAGNSSIVLPTKSMTVPGSLRPSGTGAASATKSAPPESTGAASSLKAGLSFAGAVAAFAFML